MIWVETRYREVLEEEPGPWVPGPTVPDGTRDLRIDGPELGRTYEVQFRRVDPSRDLLTRWVPLGAHVIDYTLPAAPPVKNPRVVCGQALTWDPRELEGPGDLRVRILHAPGDHKRTPDMVPAVDGWPAAPPFDLCLIPKGIRTIAVVPIDLEGQEGEPAFVVTNRGPYDDAEPVAGRETAFEEPDPVLLTPWTWSEPELTIEGGSIAGAFVQQTNYPGTLGQQPFYIGRGVEPFYRGKGSDDFYVTAKQQMTITVKGYYSGSLNGGYDIRDDRGVITLDVQFQHADRNWYVEYRRNSSPFYIGGGGDPFYIGTGSSLFRHGLDGSSPFYGDGGDEFYEDGGAGDFYRVHPWRPWPGRLGGMGPTRIDFRLVVPASVTQGRVERFAIRETLPAKGGKWLTGQGAPATALGDVGDFYLDATTGDFYEKQPPAAWLLKGNLQGPAGSAGGAGGSWTTIVKPSSQLAIGDTAVDISGMTVAVLAGQTIRFRAYLRYTTQDVNTGGMFAVNGPSASAVTYVVREFASATSVGWATHEVLDEFTARSQGPGGTEAIGFVEGAVKFSAPGTFALRAKAEALLTMDVYEGSWMEYQVE